MTDYQPRRESAPAQGESGNQGNNNGVEIDDEEANADADGEGSYRRGTTRLPNQNRNILTVPPQSPLIRDQHSPASNNEHGSPLQHSSVIAQLPEPVIPQRSIHMSGA